MSINRGHDWEQRETLSENEGQWVRWSRFVRLHVQFLKTHELRKRHFTTKLKHNMQKTLYIVNVGFSNNNSHVNIQICFYS
jgi:hypothetical protein